MSTEKFDEAKKFQKRLNELFTHLLGKTRGGPALINKKTGISPGTISEWMNETAPTTPDQGSLRRISEVFGVSFEWLATGRGTMLPEPKRVSTFTFSDLRTAGEIVEEAIRESEAREKISQPIRDLLAEVVAPGIAMGLSSEAIRLQVSRLVAEISAAAKTRKGSE